MENDSRKNIWISGSRGFIGTHLVSELQKYYHLQRISNTKQQDNIFHSCNNRPTYIDFQNGKSINRAIEDLGLPDIFIHLGWGDMTNPHSGMHLDTNVKQSKNLIKVLYEAGLEKFVFLGSMNEYGEQIGSLDEKMKSNGEITNYAKGKIEVASFGFEKAKETNRKFIHIRLFYTYGPMQKKKSLIQDLYQSYKNNTTVSLGPCEHYRDYIYISDVIKGIRLLCDIDESTTINLGSGSAIKLKKFINIFWQTLGGKSEMLHFGEKTIVKEQAQLNCFASLDRLQRLTGGWKPTISIKEGIIQTIKEMDKMYRD